MWVWWGCGLGVYFVKVGEFGEEGVGDVWEGVVGEVVLEDEEGEEGEGEDGEKVKVGKSCVEGWGYGGYCEVVIYLRYLGMLCVLVL